MDCRDCFYFDSCKRAGKKAVISVNGVPIDTRDADASLFCPSFIQQFRFNLED